MNLFEEQPTVYTAQSRHLFYARFLICRYAIENGFVPLNPFNLWGYFLYDMVERDKVRRANNNVLRLADEVWAFGPVADGVLAEVEYAMTLHKTIRFLSAGSRYEDIKPLNVSEITFESEAVSNKSERDIRDALTLYLSQHPVR